MPKKRKKDDYYVPAPDTKRRCVITGCTAPVVAQVDDDSYADGWKLLRGYSRKKKGRRRPGEEPLYACEDHLKNDARIAKLQMQFCFV